VLAADGGQRADEVEVESLVQAHRCLIRWSATARPSDAPPAPRSGRGTRRAAGGRYPGRRCHGARRRSSRPCSGRRRAAGRPRRRRSRGWRPARPPPPSGAARTRGRRRAAAASPPPRAAPSRRTPSRAGRGARRWP
jgi:hypothetical protein